MKRISCITLLGASLFLFSCEEDPLNPDSSTAIPDQFSSKTVEENKAQLEDNGIKLLNNLEGLKDVKAIETAANLVELLDAWEENYDEEPEAIPGGRILTSLSTLRTEPKSATKVFSAMRLKGDVPDEEPESVQHFFDVYSGTYTWQSTEEDWDFVAGGNSLVFKFPAEGSGSSNNAIITIGGYAGIEVNYDEYSGDVPTNLAMDMVVDGSKVLEYSFKATYNGSHDPETIETTLTLAPYVFKVDFKNTTTKVEANASLKNGSETLIAIGGSSTGKYSVNELETVDEDDIVEEASAYFQVYNIKIAGNVDVKSINAGMDEIYPEGYYNDTTFNEQAANEKEVELYNDNYDLVVFYVDSNEKIADTEFYAYTHTSTYTSYEDRNGDGSYEEYEYTNEYPSSDMRFSFADGSKNDFETYFDTGFGELEAELESFIEAFE